MDLSKMSTEEARAIVLQAQNVFDASIADQQRSSPKEIQSYPIDLSIERTRANAIKVSFPFKSLLVEQASDINTFVYVVPISNESGNDPLRMGLRDVYKSEFGFRECYIYWNAQAGKSMLLKFFVRSNIENGRLVLDQNSQYSNFQVGAGSASNDGFTILLKARQNDFLGNNTYNDHFGARITGVNTKEYDTGIIYDSGGSNPQSTFKVPAGFTAEIIGIEAIYNYAITSGAYRNMFLEADDGLFFDGATFYLAANTNGITRLILAGQPFPQNPNPTRIYGEISDNRFPVVRKNRKFEAGKILVYLTRVSTNPDPIASINTDFYILVRLTKNVE